MQRSRPLLAAMCVALLVVAGSGAALAQAIHDGKVTGTVVSEDGFPLPEAQVELAGPALLGGSRTATTTENGVYVFMNVPVGTYTVTVSREAFKTIVRERIVVTAASVVTVDITLPVGVVEETVSVTAEGPIVDTKTSTIDAKLGFP